MGEKGPPTGMGKKRRGSRRAVPCRNPIKRIRGGITQTGGEIPKENLEGEKGEKTVRKKERC